MQGPGVDVGPVGTDGNGEEGKWDDDCIYRFL